jgi:hypothetical protein
LASALVLVAGWTVSCSPARQFAERAAALGMRAASVAGTEFRHVVFEPTRQASRTVHVYIDGDGTPWLAGRPAPDPTPRNALLLRLIALDPAPSLYLGRPCYHGLAETPPCSSVRWTHQRYSEAVVASMAAALRRVLEERGFERVIWIGYSGGGTLAMLLAPRFSETAGVVTVAANLDVDAWADLHGYARLVGSLNPARQPSSLPPDVYQRHYVGGKDRVVPIKIVARGPVSAGTVVVVPGYDHRCCWQAIWPAVLSEVVQATGSVR